MKHKCGTLEQGYPSITHMKDCSLSHTGYSLVGLSIIALIFILAGIFILWMGRSKKSA